MLINCISLQIVMNTQETMNLYTCILNPAFFKVLVFFFNMHGDVFLAELLPHVSRLIFIAVVYLPQNNFKYGQGLILFLFLTSWRAHNTAEET